MVLLTACAPDLVDAPPTTVDPAADTAADSADTGVPPADPRLAGQLQDVDADGTLVGGFNTMGYWLSAADFDGDGRDELVTSDAYNGADRRGEVYVVASLGPGEFGVTDALATIGGAEAGGEVGNSATALEDVTGDGVPDLAFLDRAESAYLFAGPVTGALTVSDADTVLAGVDRTDERASQIAAGDLDGDGQADLALSAQRDFGDDQVGDVWVVRGPVSADSVELATTAAAHLAGDNASERAGWSLAVGDADGDGIADLWTSAVRSSDGAGAVYLYAAPAGELALADADVVLTGAWAGAGLGHQLAADGDFDGDGHPDLLVSASGTSDLGLGAVYLFSGPLDGLGGVADAAAVLVSDLGNTAGGFTYACHADFAGDPDGDGFTDVLSSDCEASGTVAGGGVVGLHYGPLSGTVGLSSAGLVVEGTTERAGLGKDVGGVGDLDGDGFDDVAMGSFSRETVYLWFGGRL